MLPVLGALILLVTLAWAVSGSPPRLRAGTWVERRRMKWIVCGYAAFDLAALSVARILRFLEDPGIETWLPYEVELGLWAMIAFPTAPAMACGLALTALVRGRDAGLVLLSISSVALAVAKVVREWTQPQADPGGIPMLTASTLNTWALYYVYACGIVTLVGLPCTIVRAYREVDR